MAAPVDYDAELVRFSAVFRRAFDRLRDAFAAHLTDHGVWFDARAWLVTAHSHGSD